MRCIPGKTLAHLHCTSSDINTRPTCSDTCRIIRVITPVSRMSLPRPSKRWVYLLSGKSASAAKITLNKGSSPSSSPQIRRQRVISSVISFEFSGCCISGSTAECREMLECVDIWRTVSACWLWLLVLSLVVVVVVVGDGSTDDVDDATEASPFEYEWAESIWMPPEPLK